jgi:hemerythrin-like domain-containing protein
VTRDPFAVLLTEHEHALAALARLESAAEGLEADPACEPDRRAVRAVLDLLQGPVRDHNEKEERALVPLLGEDAPVAIFEEEHRALWTLEQELGCLLAGPGDDPRVVPVAREIVHHLRSHIQRENEVLFPMARALLGPEGLERLARQLGPE